MLERWVARARVTSGLVMFIYVTCHLLNLSLGLASLSTMNAVLAVAILFWGDPVVQVVLGASILVHLALALRALWRRRTLQMSRAEAAQTILGFLIPFMLALHVSKTRVAETHFGAHISYSYELLQFWKRDPLAGIEQVMLMVVAWTHACIGINFNLKLRRWYPQAKPVLLICAFTVPFVAALGFVRAGLEVRMLAENPQWVAAVDSGVGLGPHQKAELLRIALSLRMIVLGLLGLLLVAREARRHIVRARGTVLVTYPHGKRIRVPRGTSVLEASRDAGVPHTSICGGHGRCSTCRTLVSGLHVADPAPCATEFERAVLDRMKLPPGVRLACQFRPENDVAVTPLIRQADARRALMPGPQVGAEQEIAIMFCDLRGFTSLSEHRLPYDVVFLLNRYFAVMGEAIETSGGRIDKFIGDGIMALFGVGDPAGASRSALAAAYRMSRALDRLNETFAHELPNPLRIGIGIHLGTVVVGEMGWGAVKGLTAIGDCVNTASRLEALSKTYAAELVISDAVERQARLDLSGWPGHEITARGRTTKMRIRAFKSAQELETATVLSADRTRAMTVARVSDSMAEIVVPCLDESTATIGQQC